MSIYEKFIEASTTSTPKATASAASSNPENTCLKFNFFQPPPPPPPKITTRKNGVSQNLHLHRDDETRSSWLQLLRFEPELEPMSCMEARTLTGDKNCASLMAIKCSYIKIRDIREESKEIFNSLDCLIKECLSLQMAKDSISKFHSQFSQLEDNLMKQIHIIKASNVDQQTTTIVSIEEQQKPLTITFSTPRKSRAVVTTLKPIDRLSEQIITLCCNYTSQLERYLARDAQNCQFVLFENGLLDAELRTLREIYEKFLDIVIRAECLIIIEALHYYLSTNNTSNQQVVESPYLHLPLKYSLMYLWKLTDNDPYLVSLLTEKWQTTTATTKTPLVNTLPKRVARRLDFASGFEASARVGRDREQETKFDDLIGVLVKSTKQISPISLLEEIIINQPNKHHRLDLISFMRHQRAQTKLIDLDEESSFKETSAIYTGNQYKEAALRILNHFSINDYALRQILKLVGNNTNDCDDNLLINSIFGPYLAQMNQFYLNQPSMLAERVKEMQDDAVVREALSLFVQITSPFHQSNSPLVYMKLIGEPAIDSLVKHLTSIISTTRDSKLLLLSLDVIANVSFVTRKPMDFYGTNRIVLNLIRAQPSDLEIRDRAITLFANLTTSDNSIEEEALLFVLSCLESCVVKMFSRLEEHEEEAEEDEMMLTSFFLNNNNQARTRRPIDLKLTDLGRACNCDRSIESCKRNLSLAELAALERIHQKAAVAVARLASGRRQLSWVLKQDAARLLVELCKFKHKRNASERVLVACVEALKRLSKLIGSEQIKHYNGLDLIELELGRILEIYGN